MTAGTPGHMYLDDRQAKCLNKTEKKNKMSIHAFIMTVCMCCYRLTVTDNKHFHLPIKRCYYSVL